MASDVQINKKGPSAATLKEFFMYTQQTMGKFTGKLSYEEMRTPGGAEFALLKTLKPEELAAFSDPNVSMEEKFKKFGEGSYTIEDIDVAAADLIKEGGDLDSAMALQPAFNEYKNEIAAIKAVGGPDMHEKFFETTLVLMAKTLNASIQEDLLETLLGKKKDYTEALDQMHEDEVLGSSFALMSISMKVAEANGVDVQAVLKRVQDKHEPKAEPGLKSAVHADDMTAKVLTASEPPKPEGYPGLAALIEGRITNFYGQHGLDTDTQAHAEAHEKLLTKLHDVQAGGDPAGMTEAFDAYRKTVNMKQLISDAPAQAHFNWLATDVTAYMTEQNLSADALKVPAVENAQPAVDTDLGVGLPLPGVKK